jgi:hypothetical protein
MSATATTRVRDVPRKATVIRHLDTLYGFSAACARVRPRVRLPADTLLRLEMPKALVTALRRSAREAISKHGLHCWLTREGRASASYYESLSLTYNPDLRDPGIRDVHQSTLGNSVNPGSEGYYGSTGRFRYLKDTYFDTYGFRRLTPAATTGALGEFLAECRLSLVRSRLSVLYGDSFESYTFQTGWHRDEPVFENLRINIPLVSHPNYRLQIERVGDRPRQGSRTMTMHYLRTGKAYTLDTHRPHRVLPVGPCRVMRVHLVLGFAPWFTYEPQSDTWAPNAYFGRVHPFDIAGSGGLHPRVGCS